jgi:hypothetical protein
MSIDARVYATDISGDGREAIIYLVPRTNKNPAGQRKLFVQDFDGWLPPIGSEIWGNSGELLIGNEVIYKRIGDVRVKRVSKR